MNILSKDQIKSVLNEQKSEFVALPQFGEGFGVKVRAFGIGEILDIQGFATETDSQGNPRYNAKNDVLASVIAAVEEPQFTIDDAEFIYKLSKDSVDRIVGKAFALGGRTQSAFDEFKALLRSNIVLRRIYLWCATHGRLPHELDDVPESDFMMMVAALELEDEDEQARKPQASQDE